MPCNISKSPSRKMGIGLLGDNRTSIKKKHRWTLQIEPYCTKGSGARLIGPDFVKVAARPSYDIEETELNFLNAKTWIAGKLSWQSVTVTYIDAGSQSIADLYNWIGKNAQLNSNDEFKQGTSFLDYAATIHLTMYDGCGNAMEDWELKNAWPQAVNFGDLDQSSSEEATIELTIRYDQVCYASYCPATNITPCCSPCTPVA